MPFYLLELTNIIDKMTNLKWAEFYVYVNMSMLINELIVNIWTRDLKMNIKMSQCTLAYTIEMKQIIIEIVW